MKNLNIVFIESEMMELAANFLKNRRVEIAEMRDALSSGDFNHLEILGHRLRGNGPGYGFEFLGVAGADIERDAKLKDAKLIEASINKIESYLADIQIVSES